MQLQRRRISRFIRLGGLLALFASAVVPSEAQSATPRNGSVTLNSAAGNPGDAEPRYVIHSNGTFATTFDGNLVVGGFEAEPLAGFMLERNGTLYGAPHLTALSEAPTKSDWTSATVSSPWADRMADVVLTADTITITISYFVWSGDGLQINVTTDTPPTDGSATLYLVADTNARGTNQNRIERSPSLKPVAMVAADYPDSDLREVVGIVEYPDNIPLPNSAAVASTDCIWGRLSGCPTSGPADGSGYSENQPDAYDLAIGAEWDMIVDPLPRTIWLVGTAEEETQEEALISQPAQQCLNTTDMAISPERIELAPGGEAVVNLTLRNTDTVPQGYHDVVLSLSDGLSVTAVSDGMRNLGQRAALEQLILQPNETRSMAVTVTAAENLPTAPLHVAELYCGGRVVSRTDGVFVTPAPVSAPVVTLVEAPPAPAAAPAPLPVVLPNTAGEQMPLSVPFIVWPALIAALAVLLMRRRSA
jgi:hypothetical protein